MQRRAAAPYWQRTCILRLLLAIKPPPCNKKPRYLDSEVLCFGLDKVPNKIQLNVKSITHFQSFFNKKCRHSKRDCIRLMIRGDRCIHFTHFLHKTFHLCFVGPATSPDRSLCFLRTYANNLHTVFGTCHRDRPDNLPCADRTSVLSTLKLRVVSVVGNQSSLLQKELFCRSDLRIATFTRKILVDTPLDTF